MSHDDEPYEYQARDVGDHSGRWLVVGEGRISGYLSASLGILSLLSVLAFMYPSYLTTPDLRASYYVTVLRMLLEAGMWSSLIFGLLTFLLGRRKRMGAVGIVASAIALGLGGWNVPLGELRPSRFTLGVDWLVLDLLGSVALFVFIEKIWPKYREQAILRPAWRLDLTYFALNHLAVGAFLVVGNGFAPAVFGWATNATIQGWVTSLPVWGQIVLLVFAADLVQYWVHRMFHEVPVLWRFHAVHHSTEQMDWLAGSRTHFVQVLADRTLVMVPLYLLGPAEAALNGYVVVAGFQAVFIHANFGMEFGPLKYLVATPQFHHWHHSAERPAIDTNYAVHLPLCDMLFGSFHLPGKHWPAHYGTVKPIPRTLVGQLLYPFLPERSDDG